MANVINAVLQFSVEAANALGATILAGLGIEPQRDIKDVDSWDGSASRWDSTAAYCSACLIDVNAAAGRDEKAQSHCMLPVREPGDSSDTYVRQAIHAAAGGRGITRVTRPDDVSTDEWDSAVKAAANKIIAAYNEMDETAPDSVYQAAGKEPPEAERSLSNERLYEMLYMQLCNDHDAWLMEIFHDAEQMYVIGTRDGQLWKFPFTTTGEEVIIQEPTQVTVTHPEISPMRSTTTIKRQSDGRYRWVSVSCSAVLNRDGQLDSRALFDAFEENVAARGYPIRQFYHEGVAFRTGEADYVGREGFLLVTSGLFDETELARRELAARERDPDYWGESIGFRALDGEWLDVDGVQIPVFTDGYISEISTLPEQEAAALFTRTYQFMEVSRMQKGTKQWDAFLKLFEGDEAAADTWLAEHADELNREIQERSENDGLIVRNIPPAEAPGEQAPQTGPLPEVIQRLVDGYREMTGGITEIAEQLPDMAEAIARLDERLNALEAAAAERARQWQLDLPAAWQRPKLAATVRPRDVDAGEEPPTSSDVAGDTLRNKGFDA